MLLFHSRRIGLSENGDAIPILAGTRLTGRQGRYSVGVMNIQQREYENAQGLVTPATNFTALRVRRDILANSDFGAVLLNKDENGPRFNLATAPSLVAAKIVLPSPAVTKSKRPVALNRSSPFVASSATKVRPPRTA